MRRSSGRNVNATAEPANVGSGVEGLSSVSEGIPVEPTDGNLGATAETFGGLPVTDPADIAGTGAGSDSGGTGKRRGRPPGSRNGGTAAKTAPKNLTETIANSLHGLHMFAAGVLQAPELVLDQKEAQSLGEALRAVSDQYTVNIDPKMVAWGNLMLVCGMVYGPRFIAIKNRRKGEPKQPRPVAVPIRETPPRANAATAGSDFQSPSQMYAGSEFGFGVQD